MTHPPVVVSTSILRLGPGQEWTRGSRRDYHTPHGTPDFGVTLPHFVTSSPPLKKRVRTRSPPNIPPYHGGRELLGESN